MAQQAAAPAPQVYQNPTFEPGAITSSSGAVDLVEARAWCKAYTKERAKNFYYAFAILPEVKRDAIYAAYAFSGYVDDIADELTDGLDQETQLRGARHRLHACAAGDREGPLFTALGAAFDEFHIPVEYFEELINGVEMDFTKTRYQTWDELYQYCYRVASMVGLICTSVFGTGGHPRAKDFATHMGIGLQIVNIMRDVKEDAARGRVYFPQDELAKFNLTDADILAGTYDARFRDLMAFEGERARRYFRSGRRLRPLLDVRSRMCVNVLQGIYFEILKRIEKRNYDVLSERVSLSTAAKLGNIGKLWVDAALIPRKR
ncbi:MAG: phytoene/squalene synthase family protein [Dehalococcoidia bacterium]